MDNCRSVVCEHSPIDGRPRAHRIQRWYAISGSDIASVHDGGRRPSPERVPAPMTTSRTSTLLERRLATQAVSMQVAPRSIAACVRRCCPKNNVPSFRCMTAARCRRGHASNSTRSGSRGDAPRDRRDGGRDGGQICHPGSTQQHQCERRLVGIVVARGLLRRFARRRPTQAAMICASLGEQDRPPRSTSSQLQRSAS